MFQELEQFSCSVLNSQSQVKQPPCGTILARKKVIPVQADDRVLCVVVKQGKLSVPIKKNRERYTRYLVPVQVA